MGVRMSCFQVSLMCVPHLVSVLLDVCRPLVGILSSFETEALGGGGGKVTLGNVRLLVQGAEVKCLISGNAGMADRAVVLSLTE